MSRYEMVATVRVAGVQLDRASVAYGLDHICGYFIQVFSPDDPDEIVLNVDSLFTGLTDAQMLEWFHKIGIYDRIPQRHMSEMALDLLEWSSEQGPRLELAT